jgi:hypothetical protein
MCVMLTQYAPYSPPTICVLLTMCVRLHMLGLLAMVREVGACVWC